MPLQVKHQGTRLCRCRLPRVLRPMDLRCGIKVEEAAACSSPQALHAATKSLGAVLPHGGDSEQDTLAQESLTLLY